MKVSLKAPAGASGISVRGHSIEVGKDGLVSVDAELVDDLISHGYSHLDGEAPALSGRAGLVDSTTRSLRLVVESLTEDQLEKFAALGDDHKNMLYDGIRTAMANPPSAEDLAAAKKARDEEQAAEEAEKKRLAEAAMKQQKK